MIYKTFCYNDISGIILTDWWSPSINKMLKETPSLIQYTVSSIDFTIQNTHVTTNVSTIVIYPGL